MWRAGSAARSRVRRYAAAALVLGAVGVMVPPPALATPEADATQRYGGAPAWGGCENWVGDTTGIPTAQCATVAVPADWAADDAGIESPGAPVQLAVIRIPATGERIGALMVNPGGPGASAVTTVAGMGAALADTELLRRFDLVGFDPRGSGASTPELRCRTDAEFDAWRREPMTDYSPAGVARIEDLYRQFGQRCLDRMGAPALSGMATATTARDMDVVRAALGDEQINYLGFSYGTVLGAEYAERFGDRVRAMVLDGAVDPNMDPIERSVRQMAGFQAAFDEYAADCAQSAGCPLGTDPAQFVTRFRELVDPLVAEPGRTADPRGLSYSDAITGTVSALYSKRYWLYLTSGLLGLQRGTDADDLLTLADQYLHRDAQGHYSNQQDVSSAVRCVDSAFPTDPAAWVDADRRVRDAAPFATYGEFTGFAPRDLCAMWPVPPSPSPPVSPAPPGTVVVVSTTRDPATPYQAGVDLAADLGAALVTFDGSQHTVVFNGDACVDTTILAFLTDLTEPPAGLRC
ncbi:MAG: alpha/beta hydrolase [Actinobacteria bacterium]|nr:alpha/beta hydrolase [Actinomycetota bacterium]